MGLIKNDSDKKPLFRQFIKQELKNGVVKEEITDTIIKIRLSGSGEWIIFEGNFSVALMNAESKAGKELWELLQTFVGELKALMLVPAKNKLGFDLEPHPINAVVWNWEDDAVSFNATEEEKKSIGNSLSFAAMQLTPTNSAKLTKSTPKNNSKVTQITNGATKTP